MSRRNPTLRIPTAHDRELDREVRRRVRMYMSGVSCHRDVVLDTFFTYWPMGKVTVSTRTMREGLSLMARIIRSQFDMPMGGGYDA